MSKSKGRTFAGILLILTGTVILVLLLLYLLGFRPATIDLGRWFSQREKKDEVVLERPRIVAPKPTGSSELEEFYARHPQTAKRNHKEDEEIDTSLWKTDYYTSPEGVSWKKDSNSDKVLSETKKGEQEYTTEPSVADTNPQNQSLHVEFWESPVNYRGYKLANKQLIVFGLSPDEDFRFEHHQDGIWMHYNGKIYLLRENSGYMPFVERGAQLSQQDSLMAVQAGLAAEQHVREK